jgi:hypothetical protein
MYNRAHDRFIYVSSICPSSVVSVRSKAPGIHGYVAGSIPAVTPRWCTIRTIKCSSEHKKNIFILWEGETFTVCKSVFNHRMHEESSFPINVSPPDWCPSITHLHGLFGGVDYLWWSWLSGLIGKLSHELILCSRVKEAVVFDVQRTCSHQRHVKNTLTTFAVNIWFIFNLEK